MSTELILVLNCGSSSIKFAVVNPTNKQNILFGEVQRIDSVQPFLIWRDNRGSHETQLEQADYRGALFQLMHLVQKHEACANQIVAVGHRVVHGGESFSKSVVIDQFVLKTIGSCKGLAPLHNPANLTGIEVAKEFFPNLPQVAVFDTGFHQTMPDYAFLYPIPYSLYEQFAVRRYGFHGISHRFVIQQAAVRLNRLLSDSAFISAHLGNGCSVTAVLNGRSVDTTMGLTPLEGVMMGTRSGDVDPGLHAYLAEKLNCDVQEVTRMLNRESGLLGISGAHSDMREINKSIAKGDERARLAKTMFCYRLAKHIASLMVPLSRVDALIFTGGIGENDADMRAEVLQWLHVFHFEIDDARNKLHGQQTQGIITKDETPIAMVIPTNEALLIAEDTFSLIHKDA